MPSHCGVGTFLPPIINEFKLGVYISVELSAEKRADLHSIVLWYYKHAKKTLFICGNVSVEVLLTEASHRL
jgi:hypothetical protein